MLYGGHESLNGSCKSINTDKQFGELLKIRVERRRRLGAHIDDVFIDSFWVEGMSSNVRSVEIQMK